MSIWERWFKRKTNSPPSVKTPPNETPPNEMPSNWDDHEGWDRYYKALAAAGKSMGEGSEHSILRAVYSTAQYLVREGLVKVWVPGCGISLVPGVCAAMGLRIWASDASAAAIQIQQSRPPYTEWAPRIFAQLETDEAALQEILRPGELHLRVHDFRTSFEESDFDWIFNIKALQALPPESMEKAAKVHWEALKPGGTAYFSTHNVQGPHRTRIEECLIRAGFHVPYHTVEKWYRQELNSTGVDYVFLIGRPMARGASRESNQKRLDEFAAEYERRMQEEQPRLQEIQADGVTRIAYVLYSTG